jgi:uncharacterized protein YcbX
MAPRVIGKVAALFRYPVKSMGSEPLESVDVDWNGFAGDRRWAFIRGDLVRSGFPWLTIRENPTMWHYMPRFVEPSRPDDSVTMVRTPSGTDLDVVDPALAELLGHNSRVIKQSRGVFDTFPLSLLTSQSVAGLSASVGRELDKRRFRPNLFIESSDGGDAPENSWIGETLQIGEIQMRIDKRDKRCVMINVDPVTTEKDPAILRSVAQERDSRFGVYGTPVKPGKVKVGDTVSIVR